ncbi:hypothetical protein DW797_10635 [Ruminococcus sp. AM31-32]|uniref:MobQ family relaxase n=1 Tax=Agathobacter rectalis TaxID=39491 RepID=UPI000E551473|nr:MobQ family relaxase [Ruminococcus sp. AM31-32]RGH62697.1 hypothetical protein DW797_10635 [Ruminococcus sp. AM31-32]RHD33316.1 hypothetical protein DW798_14365 [Agathobacter rectalis]
MAIYSCECKVFGRAKGQSAVGKAAYRSGEKLTNEYDGMTHDYTKKGGVVYSEIMLCENAPKEYQDRVTLWNAVEKVEKDNGARLAREYRVCLQREFTLEENIEVVRKYIKENFTDKGMIADYSIHDKNDGNPHAHIMLTMRPLDEKGKWQAKMEKVYICKNAAGEEKEFTAKELKSQPNGEWEKQLPYYKNGNVKSRPVYLTKTQAESDLKYKDYCRVKGKNDPKKSKEDRVNPIIQQWDSTETLNSCRENWAKINNEKFEEKGLNIRISHLSLKEQGIDRIPTIHEGAARNMEKRGIETERGNINREIKQANGQMQTIEILEKQTQKEIAFIREDISWNRHHEEIAKIEEQIPKAAGNEKVLLSVQAGLLKLYDKAKLIEPTKTSEGRTIEIDGRKVPYFEYHKNKLVGDISFAQDKVKGYIDMLAQQRQEAPQEQGGFAARREVFKQQEAPQEKPKIDTAYVERMAQQLATVRNEFVRETVNSHERTNYQPNPIYARQANEIESIAKTVAEQSRTIEAFKAERDKLGMFKGKEKKEIQGKIDNFERLRRSNLDKLKALGVSDLSKADEAAKEKRTLAAQEQEKAQAARRNEGAGSRAEEAKKVFLEVAKRIPADQRQTVLERMEQYNSHEAGGMEVFKAEIEARRVLDSALKEQIQDREHEKTKVKGRGRTD